MGLKYIKGKPISSVPGKIKKGKKITQVQALNFGQSVMPKLRRNQNERIESQKSMESEYIN